MPHISVKLWPGKTDTAKQKLAEALTLAVKETLGSSDQSISVSIEDVPQELWAERVHRPEILDKPDLIFKKPGYTIDPQSK